MTEISFYHLRHTPLEKALPKLMEKIYASKKRAIILAANEQAVEALNQLLWSYSTKTFIPHGSHQDGFIEEQPIFLTHREENPNDATLLVVTDGRTPTSLKQFERCFDLFDGTQPESLQAARNRWKQYKTEGFPLTYWQQTEKGGWEQANT